MSIKLREKKLADGRTSLYLDVYHNGQRQYEFLNIYLTKNRKANKEARQLAENILTKRQLDIQHSEHGFIPAFKKKVNLVEYFERVSESKNPNTRAASWDSTAKLLREFTGGRINFASVTDQWLEKFRDFLLTKVSRNTAHTYFSKIKATLNQAVKDKIILVNPANNVSNIKRRDVERVYLTLDELQKLSSTPCRNNEVKRAFLFSCFTGLRLSDVRILKWNNIQDGQLQFRQKKTGGYEYFSLPEMALQILNDRANILPMKNTSVFNLPVKSALNKILKVWSKDAGIEKNISFHTSRHTFATLALTQGVELYTVSKLLGHREIQTTQIYAKIVDEKKKQAMEAMPVIKIHN